MHVYCASKNNILFNIEFFDRTFVSVVIPHPNCYFPSPLSHFERKSVACKFKTAIS